MEKQKCHRGGRVYREAWGAGGREDKEEKADTGGNAEGKPVQQGEAGQTKTPGAHGNRGLYGDTDLPKGGTAAGYESREERFFEGYCNYTAGIQKTRSGA